MNVSLVIDKKLMDRVVMLDIGLIATWQPCRFYWIIHLNI